MWIQSVVALALLVPATMAALGPSGGERSAEDLDGVWVPSLAELAGKPFPDEVRKAIRLEIKGNDYTVTVGDQPDRGTCKIDATASPKTIDITGTEGPNKGRTILAIYERKGDTLRVCYDLGGKARPTEFKSPAGSQRFLVEYQMRKP